MQYLTWLTVYLWEIKLNRFPYDHIFSKEKKVLKHAIVLHSHICYNLNKLYAVNFIEAIIFLTIGGFFLFFQSKLLNEEKKLVSCLTYCIFGALSFCHMPIGYILHIKRNH